MSYDFHMIKNDVAYLNRLQPYCATVEAHDAELVEGFPKKSIATDRKEKVEASRSAVLLSSSWKVVDRRVWRVTSTDRIASDL